MQQIMIWKKEQNISTTDKSKLNGNQYLVLGTNQRIQKKEQDICIHGTSHDHRGNKS
jgi:hypothetical protein